MNGHTYNYNGIRSQAFTALRLFVERDVLAALLAAGTLTKDDLEVIRYQRVKGYNPDGQVEVETVEDSFIRQDAAVLDKLPPEALFPVKTFGKRQSRTVNVEQFVTVTYPQGNGGALVNISDVDSFFDAEDAAEPSGNVAAPVGDLPQRFTVNQPFAAAFEGKKASAVLRFLRDTFAGYVRHVRTLDPESLITPARKARLDSLSEKDAETTRAQWVNSWRNTMPNGDPILHQGAAQVYSDSFLILISEDDAKALRSGKTLADIGYAPAYVVDTVREDFTRMKADPNAVEAAGQVA